MKKGFGLPNVYYGDSTQLTYLRARYYSSGDGRFISRDTWGGNADMPITYNKWAYANANPILYTDPNGWAPCSEDQNVDEYRYCVLDNGGFIDVEHFQFKRNTANWLIDVELLSKYGLYYGQITLAGSLGGGLPIYHSSTYLTRLPSMGLPGDKLGRIALSIIMDYEYGFEAAQAIDPRCYTPLGYISHCSSFSNEDLPSDYLGVVSAVKYLSLDTIVSILGGGEQQSSPPAGHWGKPGDAIKCRDGVCSADTPYNDQCTLKIYDPSTKKYYNRPWPSALIVQPFGFGTYWGKHPSDFHVLPPLPSLASNGPEVE
jgi:RHS repeat-associated protein